MVKGVSKKTLRWLIVAIAVVAAAIVVLVIVKAKQSALPEGIASGNGRLEATLADVVAK
jgi:HlyD family secretion protein